MRNSTKKKISLWGAISIGIGGMVGGGIFAVLGLAVGFAKGGTPIAFTNVKGAVFAGLIVVVSVIIEVIYKEHEKKISKKRCREG